MTTRFLSLLVALAAAGITAAACGGDDAPSNEEYFAEVKALDEDISARFAGLFEEETAQQALDGLAALAADYSDGLDEIEPAEDFEEAHNDLRDALDELVPTVEELAGQTGGDAPIDEFEAILFGEGDVFEATDGAGCELNAIAADKGIDEQLDFECGEQAAEASAACSDIPVDAVDVAYFCQLEAIIAGAVARFGNPDEPPANASEAIEQVAGVLTDAHAEGSELEPPEDAVELHQELLEAIDHEVEVLLEVAAGADESLPSEAAEQFFFEEPLASLFDRSEQITCELQEVADQREIGVDLDCNPDDEEEAGASSCSGDSELQQLETYFCELEAIIVRADERFETEVFEDLTNARQGLEGVADVFADTASDFAELEPPSDLEELHKQLVEDTEANAGLVLEVAADTPEDIPPEDLGPIFEQEPLASGLTDDPDEPLCRLKEIAEEREIEVGDLGCDLFEDEDEDGQDDEGQ
jgi:hypothetical protein